MPKTFKRAFLSLIIALTATTASAQVRTDFDRNMNEPFEPFQIIGNIYYVGASDLAIFLITTDQGHILIDAGFEETVPQIEANIEKLGFKVSDIKILLNNHAHTDHAGGLALMKKKSGAKLYAPKKQATQLKRGGKNDFGFGDKLTFTPVKPDKRIRNGDQITLGGTTLTAIFTPGHTKGCTSFTMTLSQPEGVYQVMFASSTTALNYDLIGNKKYKNIADDFESTFGRLRSLKVDVFLTSHASFFKLKEKRERQKEGAERNPFIDPEGYADYIRKTEKAFREKLEEQKKKLSEAKPPER